MIKPIEYDALGKAIGKVDRNISTVLHASQQDLSEFRWWLAHHISDLSKHRVCASEHSYDDDAYSHTKGDPAQYLSIQSATSHVALYSSTYHVRQNMALSHTICERDNHCAQMAINFANAIQAYSLCPNSEEHPLTEDIMENLPWHLQGQIDNESVKAKNKNESISYDEIGLAKAQFDSHLTNELLAIIVEANSACG